MMRRSVRNRVLAAAGLVLACSTWLAGQGAQAPAPAPSADALVSAAVKQAQVEGKTVFVEFGASWCAPCLRMKKFLEAPDVSQILARHFVIVPITIWETGRNASLNNPGGDELIKKWGGSAIPFYAFLGATGAPARDSRDVGFPESNEDIGAFVELLATSAPRLSAAERMVLGDHLTQGSPAQGWNVIATRRVWSAASVGAFTFRPTVSADGRLIAYNEFGGSFIHDIARNTDRQFQLPPAAADGVDGDVYDQPVLSRDGRFLAVSYVSWRTGIRDLRIVPVDSRVVPSEALFADPSVEWIRPHQWTADGKWILVALARKDSAEIGMVSATDGTLKVLKRLRRDQLADDANYTGHNDTNLLLSPDESHVVFDVFADRDGDGRDIFLLRLQDGKETPAVVHTGDDGLFGWTPDGSGLFFMSDRTGAYALWVAPLRDGAFGAPAIVRENMGEITPIGVLPSGSLLYAPTVLPFRDIWAFELDFATGERLSAPREFVHEYIGKNSAPGWSRDGSEFVHNASRDGRSLLVARTIATGATRETRTDYGGAARVWAPDGKAFAVFSGDKIQKVDARTGQATELVDNARALRAWTPDGKILFERSVPARLVVVDGVEGPELQVGVFERDLASGREREVFRGRQGGAARLVISSDGRWLYHRRPVPANAPPHELFARDLRTGAEQLIVSGRRLGPLSLSPDGRFILSASSDPATTAAQLLLIPTSPGSAVRTLRIDDGAPPNLVAFARDCRSMLASRSVKGVVEYWWVPFDDRQPKRVDLPAEPRPIQNAKVGPDGRTIVFEKMTVMPSGGVWAMEFERRMGSR